MSATYATRRASLYGWMVDKLFMGQTLRQYLRSLATPFNALAGAILLVGFGVAVVRFTQGLAATTNLTDDNPWGLWIGFDILCGVALAAGGYGLATAVYIFRLEEYHPIVRPAILTGFLGYFFVVVGLLFDLGRPWRLPFPFVVSPGFTSVMFSVGLHVMLYLGCLFVEFTPAIFEWLGWKRLRALAVKATLAVTVIGVMLSTLHQAALGGLFLLFPSKLHPLWYSPLLPLFFFVSSVFAGLAMVIVESTLAHRIFTDQIDHEHHLSLEGLTVGLGKAAAVAMFTYFWLKMMGFVHSLGWEYLNSPLGLWFMVEMLGFVLLPCILFIWGAQMRSLHLIRFTAVLTVIGIVVNRLNVSIIALNWNQVERYVPRWTEIVVTLTIVTLFLLTYRWIVNRMPVLHEHPDFQAEP